jgi:hypothetical protein
LLHQLFQTPQYKEANLAIAISFQPFIPEAFEALSDAELDEIMNLFLTPTMRKVCTLQYQLHEKQRMELNPADLSPQDFYDTTIHLRKTAELWKGMLDYCEKAMQARMAQQQEKQGVQA